MLMRRRKFPSNGGGKSSKSTISNDVGSGGEKIRAQIVDIVHVPFSNQLAIFGRCEDNRTVGVIVNNFRHTFYVSHEEDVDEDEFETALSSVVNLHYERIRSTNFKSIYGYQPRCLFAVYRLWSDKFNAIKPLVKQIEHRLHRCFGASVKNNNSRSNIQFYETDTNVVQQFSMDTKIVVGAWYSIVGTFALVYDESQRYNKLTTCDLEYSTRLPCQLLEPHKSDELAPFVLMGFDIECDNSPGMFPTAAQNAIIDIGVTFGRFDAAKGDVKITKKVVLVFGDITDTTNKNNNGEENDDSKNSPSSPPQLPVVAVEYISYFDERSLLAAFSDIFIAHDPDFVIGYNSNNFDFKYIVERIAILGLVNTCLKWSRLTNTNVYQRTIETASNQRGCRENVYTTIYGRVPIDMYTTISNSNFRLRSYKLDFVSNYFLQMSKDDVPPNKISEIHHSGPEGRFRIASYCVQDAILPLFLADKLGTILFYMQLATLTRMTFVALLERGNQLRILSLIRTEARNRTDDAVYLIPHRAALLTNKSGGGDIGGGDDDSVKRLKRLYAATNNNEEEDNNYGGNDDEELKRKTTNPTKLASRKSNYAGAHVVTPSVGYYTSPVAVFDFASLYPSLMITFNICFSTFVEFGTHARYNLSPSDLHVSSNQQTFVRNHVHHGIVPVVLVKLMNDRKAVNVVKKNMPRSSLEYKVLDSKQLAIKLLANLMYGSMGSPTAVLTNVALAESVTQYGQKYLLKTIELVNAFCQTKMSPSTKKLRVIYGDTDSVFVLVENNVSVSPAEITEKPKEEEEKENLTAVFNLCQELVEFLNVSFPGVLRMEFEKVYTKLFLLAKKKYIGLKIESPVDKPEKDYKGVEIVRRNNCTFFVSLLSHVINLLLADDYANFEQVFAVVVDYIEKEIRRLHTGQIPYASLAIGNEFRQNSSTSTSTLQPHMFVVKKMIARDPGSAPQLGDRVNYVMIKRDNAEDIIDALGCREIMKIHDRDTTKQFVFAHAEHVEYAELNKIPLNVAYYIGRQLRNPILKIFAPLLENDADKQNKLEALLSAHDDDDEFSGCKIRKKK